MVKVSTTSSTRRCALLLAVALLSSAAPSLADEGAARAHFKRGVELYDAKQYAPALESFRAAYREKASPGILQNIALCLKGLGQLPAAADAFEAALADGGESLRPETRAAIQRELEELSASVATLLVRVVDASNAPVDRFAVVIDGKALAVTAARPIHLEPGLHVVGVRVDGTASPPEKRLSFVPGPPVDVTFSLTSTQGRLAVRTKVEGATVKIDGVTVGRDAWSGEVPAGTHRVEVSAPHRQTAVFDVVVAPGATVELPVTLLAEAPDAYDKPDRKPPQIKRRYLVPMLSLFGGTLRHSNVLEEPGTERRDFTGGSLGARGGYRLSKLVSFEAIFEVGSMTAKYPGAKNPLIESSSRVTEVVLAPMVRFSTPGAARFVVGVGVGAQAMFTKATVPQTVQQPTPNGPTTEISGNGVSGTLQLDLGMQFDTGPVFFEGLLFADTYGVGKVKDDAGRRLFLASPGVRGGLRIGLGIQF